MRVLVYPQFIGRLGNNMFQIAAAIGYARKHNVGWAIRKGYVERGFNVNQVDRFFPHLPGFDGQFRGYDEPTYDYKEIPFHPQGVRLVGFWQSIKYFEHCQDEVRDTFRLKHIDGYKDYVSIHVRRGDYTQHSGSFPPVTIEYLQQALKIFTDKGYNKFIVFSDDQLWCRANLVSYIDGVQFTFAENQNEFQDLCMMASCEHNIIANSSFSWMAAFCNKNQDKIIVSPSQEGFNWYGSGAGVKNPKTLVPDNWIQIKFR